MRTIAGTFATRGEAEAARRRLEAIGVAHDSIRLNEGEGGDGSAGVVLTAKVPAEHVEKATGILAGSDEGAAEPSISRGAASSADPASGHVYFGGPSDGAARTVRPQPAAAAVLREPREPSSREPDEQARWWRRFLLITGAALLIAFIAGALLGLVVPD